MYRLLDSPFEVEYRTKAGTQLENIMEIRASKLKRGNIVCSPIGDRTVKHILPGFGQHDLVVVFTDGTTACYLENAKLNVEIE
jgi:hypothetical protein